MYKLFMAFRYLRAHKIIYFSIVAVALGIMTMVVVTSLMGGFSRDMRSRIRGMQTHIVVASADKNLWMTDYDPLCDVIARIPHVTGCAPRIEYEAWLGRNGVYRDVHIVGIVPEKEKGVSDVEDYFKRGSMPAFSFEDPAGFPLKNPGVVLGAELRGGRAIGLLTARHETTPVLCVKDFESVGYFRSGMAEYDSSYLFMHLSSAQEFLRVGSEEGRKPRANLLAVSVDDYEANGRAVRDGIVRALHERRPCNDPSEHGPGLFGGGYRCGLYRTQTWEQSKRILLQAVEVEKGMQYILLFLIVVVASFNILAIYTLVVRAKARDIGILRALGATEVGISSVFLISGGLCGLFGSIFGIFLGLTLSWNLNEIVDFLRVVSREINRMSLDSSLALNYVERGSCYLAVMALCAAAAALFANWIALYKVRHPHPWIRMIAAGLALGASAYLCSGWLPRYAPYDQYDPSISAGARWPFVIGVVLLWAFFCAMWRALNRLRRRPSWIFFGFAATFVMIAFAIAAVSMGAIVIAILVAQPDIGWPGLELFPRQIYYLDRIPVYVDHEALVYIVAWTLLVSLIFSIYPAYRAASANPIESIRDE